MHWVFGVELLGGVVGIHVDGGDADDDGALVFDELDGCLNLRSGFDPLVNEEDAIAGLESIAVNLELLGVAGVVDEFDTIDVDGEFATFADGDESTVEMVGECGAEDETERVDGSDVIDGSVGKRLGEIVGELLEGVGVCKERGDITPVAWGIGVDSIEVGFHWTSLIGSHHGTDC